MIAPTTTTAEELCAIASALIRGTPALTPHSLAREVPGWDSHAMVELIFAVEERFGFQMTSLEMEAIDGIASLAAIVARHKGGAEAGG